MMRESTTKPPMNDLIRVTLLGLGHEARAAMWWGLSLKVPEFQMQPTCNIVVD